MQKKDTEERYRGKMQNSFDEYHSALTVALLDTTRRKWLAKKMVQKEQRVL